MSLIDLIDNNLTDKNTVHSYIGLYQLLSQGKKYSAKNVMETGIYRGGSIKLWHDFFENAQVFGQDISPIETVWDGVKNNPRITLFTSTDAYDPVHVYNNYVAPEVKLDFAIDDGPHTLASMILFIKLYLPVMADDGILIIEDVQDIAWLDVLTKSVPEELRKFVHCYDLRGNKNRYDDIVFTIDRFNIFVDN